LKRVGSGAQPCAPTKGFASSSAFDVISALFIAVTLSACGSIIRPITPTATNAPSPIFVQPTSVSLSTATATPTPLPLPTPAPTDTPTLTPTPESVWLLGQVRVYPGPEHYDGDLLSFEFPIENSDQVDDPSQSTLSVDGESLGDTRPYIASSPLRAPSLIFEWAWDTTRQTGIHEITLSIPTKKGSAVSETFHVEIRPASERPLQETRADWATERTACCRIDFITNTAAARDMPMISKHVQDDVQYVENRFHHHLNEVFPIILLDNVWGNGAYAASEIVLSYVDRAYVSIDVDSVVRHEATHYATRDLGPETPTIFVEGIAVYVAGGHYKPEPLPERAAALLPLNLYIPLDDLANNFRDRQHEIAYLEAAGLVSYLVDTYGWDRFMLVYGAEDLNAEDAANWLDKAFNQVYGIGLDQVEKDYKAWLGEQDASNQIDDLRLTIKLFDTIRRYQDLYAPYQEAFPPFDEAEKRDITAEFIREPNAPENVALEALLISAREAIQQRHYDTADQLIDTVNATMDDGDFTREPLGDALAVAEAVDAAGYVGLHITLDGDHAKVTAMKPSGPELFDLEVMKSQGEWVVEP